MVYSIPLRINYEDTDAGGVVYYGNYLGYMERARNAWLRECGYPLSQLNQDHNILFVVTDARLQYHAPAKLDDLLQVTASVEAVQGAVINFSHQVLRQARCLVDGQIRVAILNSQTFKPRRVPGFLKSDLTQGDRSVVNNNNPANPSPCP